MTLIQIYNQSIREKIEGELKRTKHDFEEIKDTINPMFKTAVEELFQLDYEKLKGEIITMFLDSCQTWLNDEQYDNLPMDALLFEYNYMYSDEVEAVAYGIDGDLEGSEYDFVNGIEAHSGIHLNFFSILSFIDDDLDLTDEAGFSEVNSLFEYYLYLLVHDAAAVFVQSDIFKKISRKTIFFIALGEHDMGEEYLYYVCDNEKDFQEYLDKEKEEAAKIENAKALKEKYSTLKYHLDGLLDDLIFSDDGSNLDEILEGLNELMKHSEYGHWAMLKLGSLYLSGKGGVNFNFEKARNYFEIVLKDGRELQKRQSYMILGSMYYSGKGVPKNIFKAHEYLVNADNISELSSRFSALKTHIEKEIKELKN